MTGRRLLTSAEAGRKLGRSAGWFLRHRDDLEGRGFPRPVDGCGMRWDEAAIDAWLDARMARPAGPEPEAELIRRAQALASQPG